VLIWRRLDEIDLIMHHVLVGHVVDKTHLYRGGQHGTPNEIVVGLIMPTAARFEAFSPNLKGANGFCEKGSGSGSGSDSLIQISNDIRDPILKPTLVVCIEIHIRAFSLLMFFPYIRENGENSISQKLGVHGKDRSKRLVGLFFGIQATPETV
jgi:hypothetical protein